MQGFLYPGGSIISQGLLLLILMIGAVCFIKAIRHKKIPAPAIVFACFFLLLLLTYVISPKVQYGRSYEAIGAYRTLGQFKVACFFSFMYFVGYYSEIKRSASSRVLSFVFLMFLVSFSIMFFYTRDTLMLKYDRDVTVNAAYQLVVLIPYLPIAFSYIKNNFLRIGIVLLMASLIILGSKRGAIVCMLMGIAFSLLYYMKHTQLDTKRVVIILLMLLIGYAFIYYSIEQNDYLIGRLEKTQKSGIGGRGIAYSVLWEHWRTNDSNLAFFFGNGTAASIGIWGNFAHNDWLELLSDNGLLGVIIYALLLISFFIMARRSILSKTYKCSLYLCILMWFLVTCFSMGYLSFSSGMNTMLLGILTAKNVLTQDESISEEEDSIID